MKQRTATAAGWCAALAAAALAAGALTACQPDSKPSGHGATAGAPAPQASYCSVFATNCGAQPSAKASTPRAVIDAVPQVPQEPSPHAQFAVSGDCRIDVQPEGIGLVAGGGLVAVHAYSSCSGLAPYDVTIVSVIQKCEAVVCADSDWRSLVDSVQADGRIPPKTPLFNLVGWHTGCEPGVRYRLAVRVDGHDAVYHDGPLGPKTEGAPFQVPPRTPGMPKYIYGAPVSYSAASCAG
jgi:hypothetical protein